MREINLLQGSDTAYQKPTVSLPRSSGRGVMWFFLGLFVLELGLWGIVYVLRSGIEKEATSTEQQINEIMAQVESKQDELSQAVSAQFGLTSFAELLDNHRRWSKVVGELSTVTLKVARYNALQAEGGDSEFVIGGVADTYADLGKVILGLETSGEFEKVQLISTDTDDQEGKVVFEIYVDVKEDLLANHEAPSVPLGAPEPESEPDETPVTEESTPLLP